MTKKLSCRTPVSFGTFGLVNSTRFPELKYQKRCGDWRILDAGGHPGVSGDDLPGIGGEYPTERALLANLERYANFYGCNGEPLTDAEWDAKGLASWNAEVTDKALALLGELDAMGLAVDGKLKRLADELKEAIGD